MQMVTSQDGTKIAYELAGAGQPLIFAVGAFNDHTRCADLAAGLADRFTVITYDRRGRGESGDTAPYAVEREAEDLAALVDMAGGAATVFGYSSGAILALHAATLGVPISGLVLFEPPFSSPGAEPARLAGRLQALVDAGRPGDAVVLFQTEAIGMPAEAVDQIRQSPMFPALEAMAQSMVYDTTITERFSRPSPAMCGVSARTLVLSGDDTWPRLAAAAAGLAGCMPTATYRRVPGGVNHDIPVPATADLIRDFLT